MNELGNVQKCRKVASASLRAALQKAVDRNKRPSYAISLQIKKVVWTMLVDGKPLAEAEINDMVKLLKIFEDNVVAYVFAT